MQTPPAPRNSIHLGHIVTKDSQLILKSTKEILKRGGKVCYE